MQKLTISIEDQTDLPNTKVIHFVGDFDGYAKENISDLQKLIDESPQGTRLIFDLEKLNFLNSYAIGHLVSWHNHLVKGGGEIIIVSVNKSVEEIFSILGITNIFKIFTDLNSAMAALREG